MTFAFPDDAALADHSAFVRSHRDLVPALRPIVYLVMVRGSVGSESARSGDGDDDASGDEGGCESSEDDEWGFKSFR